MFLIKHLYLNKKVFRISMKFKNLRNYSFKSIGCIFSSLPLITLYRSQQLVEQRHADSSLFLSSLWTHHETHGLLRNDQELRTSPRSACAPPPMSYVWNEGSRRNYLKLVRTAHHNVTSQDITLSTTPSSRTFTLFSYCFFIMPCQHQWLLMTCAFQ